MPIRKMELELTDAKAETSEVKSFIFDLAGYDFDYKPGQHITMRLEIEKCDEKCNTRPFTLSSSPTENILMISTRISESAFKRKLNSSPKGAKIKAMGPSGIFTLQEDYSQDAVMLAGGIGITPFRSMIRFATDKQLPLRITLLYANRVPEEIAFRKELEEWKKKNSRLKIVNTISRPEESKERWLGSTGRIDARMIRSHADLDNSIFYICGPPAMVDVMISTLSAMEIPAGKIKAEEFFGY